MNVRQLQAFLAVAEHLHFGRAAEQLFMAQAPLSRTIQALESDLGGRLFERNTRSVSLTPAGKALMGPAREVLAAVAVAEAAVGAAVSGESGTVRVEFCGVAAHPLVAALSRGMRADNPGARTFYELLGFRQTEMVPGYYGGRIAAQRMSLTLAPPEA